MLDPLAPSTMAEDDPALQVCRSGTHSDMTPLPRIYPAARRAKHMGAFYAGLCYLSLLPFCVGIPGLALSLGMGLGSASGVPIAATAFLMFGSMIAVPLTLRHRSNSILRRELHERFSAQLPAEETFYVGVNIGDEFWWHHMERDWDIGLLVLLPDGLQYLGDRTGFEIRREQLTALALPTPRWSWLYALWGVHVEWAEPSAGQRGVVWLRRRDFLTLPDHNRRQEMLWKRLEAWVREAGSNDQPDANLPLPPQRCEQGTPLSTHPIVQYRNAIRVRDEAGAGGLPIPVQDPASKTSQLPIPQSFTLSASHRDLPRV